MPPLPLTRTLTVMLVVVLSLPARVHAHAIMVLPHQRGTLRRAGFNENVPEVNHSTTADYLSHFPAGDKCVAPGCGMRSQEREAGPAGWTPFTPLLRSFRWRYGVCGDPKTDPQHMRGGKFYNNAQIVAVYPQAGKISVKMNIVSHHNGFMELHVCDVKRCGGEISEDCFRRGFCYQLKRSFNPECESGMSRRCAPIDPNYPGRWHFPCPRNKDGDGLQSFGGPRDNTIMYDLPESLSCEHCVLQWFWSTANSCNPPGVRDFFDGPRAPRNWGRCPGQGGAEGGVSRVQMACGLGTDNRMRFAEEYVTCADIAISPVHPVQGRSDDGQHDLPLPRAPAPSNTPTSSPSQSPRPTRTPSPTSTPSHTSTPTPMPQPTRTPTPKPTPSRTPKPSRTSTPSPTMMHMEMADVTLQESPVESAEESMQASPEWSMEPSPEKTPDQMGGSPGPSVESSPEPSVESSPEFSLEPSPQLSLEPSPQLSLEPSPQLSLEPSPDPSFEADINERHESLARRNKRRGVISDMVLLADGRKVRSVRDGDKINVSRFRRFTLKAKVRAKVRRVEFWIDGELQRTEYRAPYVLSGNKGRRIFYWKRPILNTWFTVVTKAGGDRDEMRVMFVK